MRRAFAAVVLGIVAAACGDDRSAALPPAPVERPPAVQRPRADVPRAAVPDVRPPAVKSALAILREGAAGVPTSPSSGSPRAPDDLLDPGRLRSFLEHAPVRSAVQFSDASSPRAEEMRLVAVLAGASDEDALQALAALIRVRAPRDIALQWQALCRLDLRHRDEAGWRDALAALRQPFTAAAIDEALREEPPADRYEQALALSWAARAAGVTGHRGALPRLVELSRADHLDVSLAAERSLEEFPGPAGEEALVQCILGWRYDAYVRAATTLAARNGPLLDRTLVEAVVPDAARREVGLILARRRHVAAVPHLCASVGKTAIVDGKMFDAIEALATAEQFPLVEALPGTVRAEQRERAEKVVAAVRERLGR